MTDYLTGEDDGKFTVHYDAGGARFEKFDTHDEAVNRVTDLALRQGRIAIILEDHDD